MRYEIIRAIALTISNKILRDNETTNKILKQISITIMPHLHRIYNAYLKKSYCLKHFRNAIIIALRKLSKSNYFIVTSYRFIALLNTLSKILEFMLVKRISYLTKTHKLLSHTHIKARKFVSTKYALHYLVKRIHAT